MDDFAEMLRQLSFQDLLTRTVDHRGWMNALRNCPHLFAPSDHEKEAAIQSEWDRRETEYHDGIFTLSELRKAATDLRNAQREYMKDRGNDDLGKKVAEAANALDIVLGLAADK